MLAVWTGDCLLEALSGRSAFIYTITTGCHVRALCTPATDRLSLHTGELHTAYLRCLHSW